MTPWPNWYVPPGNRGSVAARAIRAAAIETGVGVIEMTGSARSRRLVHARWAVMETLRHRGWSMPRIGKVLGGRDHTTVLHGLRQSSAQRRASPDFDALCNRVGMAAL